MIDIHTHLYWKSFDDDQSEVLARAKDAGITDMLVVGTTVEESKQCIELAIKYPQLFATVGIHPNEIRGYEIDAADIEIATDVTELESLVLAHKDTVVAIGECGLDYSESHGGITAADKENQKRLFEAQIELASQYQLPLIVHCRSMNAETDEAYWDLLEILKNKMVTLPAVIIHCYMGSVSVTKEFLQLSNVYFSFTGNITYPIKKEVLGGDFDITKTVRAVPLERIFTETDCPFLAPQAYRGKRNEPAFVVSVAEKIAELQGVALSEIEQKTEENFQKVFR